VNTLLENVIKDRFKLTTVKMEHLRSSAFYEQALQHAFDLDWVCLESLLRKIQIIRTSNDKRPGAHA
jgi:hypothetical protein